MLVCSIPIRTFDINKDGRVFNQPITMQLKMQPKKPIRNFNYLKTVIKNRSKEHAQDKNGSIIKSKNNPIETHRKTLSEFNPEIAM